MSTTTERIEAVAREIKGKAKKSLGRLLGNREMEIEGRTEERGGHAKLNRIKTKERVLGKAEEVSGAAKRKIGRIADNSRMAAEGRAKQLKGRARQRANRST